MVHIQRWSPLTGLSWLTKPWCSIVKKYCSQSHLEVNKTRLKCKWNALFQLEILFKVNSVVPFSLDYILPGLWFYGSLINLNMVPCHGKGWHFTLLYSWKFFPNRAHSHWLLGGHMTSNNETISRQNLWVGNIAISLTSVGNTALLPVNVDCLQHLFS